MDDILYLVHCTPYDNYEKWDALKPSPMDIYQYPGVYFSLITKYNLHKELLYSSKYKLIFSKKLLEQQNYHINLHDYNGHINEENTFYPWTLDKLIEKLKNKKSRFMNKVIFHDPVPMKYLCMTIIHHNISWDIKQDNNNDNANDNDNYSLQSNVGLPEYPIFNDEEPDMTKIPFYCYPYEMNYNGINPLKLSSKKFYNKMAKMCNVNIHQSKIKIIEEIRTKIPFLIDNRHLLKIDEFKRK